MGMRVGKGVGGVVPVIAPGFWGAWELDLVLPEHASARAARESPSGLKREDLRGFEFIFHFLFQKGAKIDWAHRFGFIRDWEALQRTFLGRGHPGLTK